MSFTGHDRYRARFLADYSDEVVGEERRRHLGADESDDESLRELLALVHELSGIRTPPPASLKEEIWLDLTGRASQPLTLMARFTATVRRALRELQAVPRLSGAVSLGVLIAATGAFFFLTPPALSAAEVLSRADRALATLITEGKVLHRRVRVASTTEGAIGSVRAEQVIDEWLDGGSRRLAARGLRPDGVELWRYAAVATPSGPRPHLYFTAAYGKEQGDRGSGELLIVRPTAKELQDVFDAAVADGRPSLERFFTRGYIYEPILGELRYNTLLLDDEGFDGMGLKPISLSMSEAADDKGAPVYRVRLIEPTRIWFHWGRTGPIVELAACETVLDIAKADLLTKRAQVTCDTSAGATVHVERLVANLEVLPRVALPAEAFELSVPGNVPVRVQTADEEISVFAAALERARSVRFRTLPSQ